MSYAGVTGSKKVNINNVKKIAKMIRKQSKIPIGVGFGIKNYEDVKKVSIGRSSHLRKFNVEKIKEGSQNGLNNKNLAQFVGEYLTTF